MLDSWNSSIFSNIKQRLQDSAMKLVHAERNGEAFDSQLVIGVRESYGKRKSWIQSNLHTTVSHGELQSGLCWKVAVVWEHIYTVNVFCICCSLCLDCLTHHTTCKNTIGQPTNPDCRFYTSIIYDTLSIFTSLKSFYNWKQFSRCRRLHNWHSSSQNVDLVVRHNTEWRSLFVIVISKALKFEKR